MPLIRLAVWFTLFPEIALLVPFARLALHCLRFTCLCLLPIQLARPPWYSKDRTDLSSDTSLYCSLRNQSSVMHRASKRLTPYPYEGHGHRNHLTCNGEWRSLIIMKVTHNDRPVSRPNRSQKWAASQIATGNLEWSKATCDDRTQSECCAAMPVVKARYT